MNYISLLVVSVLSFLSIKGYDLQPQETASRLVSAFQLLTPGLLFSLYLILLHSKQFRIRKLILFWTTLSVGYSLALFTSLATLGGAVPFAGGLGALLVKWLFYNRGTLLNADRQDKLLDHEGIKFAILGFVAGLIGLQLFTRSSYVTDGVGFGLIISVWQILIGLICIRKAGNTAPADNPAASPQG